MKTIRVYFWNPNGTNDIEILENGIVIDSKQEALFGVNINSDHKRIGLKEALTHVAVSPMTNGNDTVKFLQKHFALRYNSFSK
jgi:hypothetical protein